MQGLKVLLIDLLILTTIIGTVVFIYKVYGQTIVNTFFGEQKVGIFIRDVPLTVSVADTPEERTQGLSGVSSLPETEGKLFIFDQDDRYGIWMKDMNFAIDIMWIDSQGHIVHIEENVRPETYPTIYNSPVPARFVLETNAFYVSTFRISIGDRVTIPAHILPEDIRP